jgi:DNA/RNA endonuclease YhcR with UshA esterase domain
MKVLLTAVAITTALLLVPASAAAQAASPKYDSATEVTIQGKIQSIHDRQCPVSGTIGAHFMLEAVDGKVYEVHLAPAKFTKMFEMVFTPGEKVEVTGTTLVFEGKDAILARQVKHGNETVTFRDKKGNPSWN